MCTNNQKTETDTRMPFRGKIFLGLKKDFRPKNKRRKSEMRDAIYEYNYHTRYYNKTL